MYYYVIDLEKYFFSWKCWLSQLLMKSSAVYKLFCSKILPRSLKLPIILYKVTYISVNFSECLGAAQTSIWLPLAWLHLFAHTLPEPLADRQAAISARPGIISRTTSHGATSAGIHIQLHLRRPPTQPPPPPPGHRGQCHVRPLGCQKQSANTAVLTNESGPGDPAPDQTWANRKGPPSIPAPSLIGT